MAKKIGSNGKKGRELYKTTRDDDGFTLNNPNHLHQEIFWNECTFNRCLKHSKMSIWRKRALQKTMEFENAVVLHQKMDKVQNVSVKILCVQY